MDKRFIVDYLCKDEDQNGADETNMRCRMRLLKEIAQNLNINVSEGVDRRTLCEIINRKIVELDIASNVIQCKVGMNKVQLRAVQLGRDDLTQDYKELQTWYNDIQRKAQETINSGSLTKMTEMRNQIKGSCDTFTAGLLKKADMLRKEKKSPESRDVFSGLFRSKKRSFSSSDISHVEESPKKNYRHSMAF